MGHDSAWLSLVYLGEGREVIRWLDLEIALSCMHGHGTAWVTFQNLERQVKDKLQWATKAKSKNHRLATQAKIVELVCGKPGSCSRSCSLHKLASPGHTTASERPWHRSMCDRQKSPLGFLPCVPVLIKWTGSPKYAAGAQHQHHYDKSVLALSIGQDVIPTIFSWFVIYINLKNLKPTREIMDPFLPKIVQKFNK